MEEGRARVIVALKLLPVKKEGSPAREALLFFFIAQGSCMH
jgi:hypothetical protein